MAICEYHRCDTDAADNVICWPCATALRNDITALPGWAVELRRTAAGIRGIDYARAADRVTGTGMAADLKPAGIDVHALDVAHQVDAFLAAGWPALTRAQLAADTAAGHARDTARQLVHAATQAVDPTPPERVHPLRHSDDLEGWHRLHGHHGTATELARLLDIPAATIRAWAHRGQLTADQAGRYRAGDVLNLRHGRHADATPAVAP